MQILCARAHIPRALVKKWAYPYYYFSKDSQCKPIFLLKSYTVLIVIIANSEKMADGRVSIMAARLEEELSRFPSDLLDRPCFECHLAKLVRCIDSGTMELMAIDLELTTVEVDDIKTAWPRKPAQQRMEMFKTWREKNKSQATYRCVESY